MVRLIVGSGYYTGTPSTQFQFHYGAVDRDAYDEDVKITPEFQFHYGAVDSGLIQAYAITITIISIPLWCG